MLKIEEMESKKLKKSSQYNQSRQTQSRRENVYVKTNQELALHGNTSTIP